MLAPSFGTHLIFCSCRGRRVAAERVGEDEILILTEGVVATCSESGRVTGGSRLNPADGNSHRAENNRERQRPKADRDLQGGSGGTAGSEPDDAGESHACASSRFGQLVRISLAAGEHRKIESQLSDVRRHYRGRWRVLQSKLHQNILSRHGGDAEHS